MEDRPARSTTPESAPSTVTMLTAKPVWLPNRETEMNLTVGFRARFQATAGNAGTQASCNHGFASRVAHVLLRDVLGIRRLDRSRNAVHFDAPELPLEWCEGRIPVGGEQVALRWRQRAEGVEVDWSAPYGFHVLVEG